MGESKPDPSQTIYETYKLPDTLSPRLARKLAAMNVEAIRSVPKRTLQYAVEYTRDTDYWASQTKDPKRTTWICVSPNVKTGSVSLEEGQWVGMTYLAGPLSPEEIYGTHPSERHQEVSSKVETSWHMSRLFVAKSHRSIQPLISLYEAVQNFMWETTREIVHLRIEQGHQVLRPMARLQGCTYFEGAAYEFNLANGGTIIDRLTQTQELELDRVLDSTPQAFITGEDYTKPVVAVFESLMEGRWVNDMLCFGPSTP